jgi:peptidoglycan/xylan/chitin deacetylase (PgdA/CDA1 family)
LLYCHYLFECQRKKFERTIRYLQNIGEFVGTDRALDIIEGRTTLETNSFHLSFDDGMRNVVANALPILHDYGVPAILFVPTSLISTPPGTFCNIRRNLVTTDINAEIVTWGDLEKAHAAGFDIGSHTRTHARLADSLNERSVLEDEIAGSKADLERRLGIECRYISWPYGRLQDVNDSAVDVVRKAGYRACFGAFRGRIRPGLTSASRIPRHHFEPDWPLSHVKCFALGAWES